MGMESVQEANQQREALPDGASTFDFVEYQPHEDPKYLRKVERAKFEIERKQEEIGRLQDTLNSFELKQMDIRRELRKYEHRGRRYGNKAYSKIWQLQLVQDFMRKDEAEEEIPRLRLPEEAELIELRNKLNHQVKNKILSATEERKLMKQIKEVEATRADIAAKALSEAEQKRKEVKMGNRWRFNRIGNPPNKSWIKSQEKSIEVLKEMGRDNTQKGEGLRKKLEALDPQVRVTKERIDTAKSKLEKALDVVQVHRFEERSRKIKKCHASTA